MKSHTIYSTIISVFCLSVLIGCQQDTIDKDPQLNTSSSDDKRNPKNFLGIFKQVDYIGRPETSIGFFINAPGEFRDKLNRITPLEQSKLQPLFLSSLVSLHSQFGATYETNRLGQDAKEFTALMAKNVMQLALDGPTTYRDLTGRGLRDDAADDVLSLIFGGRTGERFNGQDINNDGIPDLPILVTDNVNADERVRPTPNFPYLEVPYEF